MGLILLIVLIVVLVGALPPLGLHPYGYLPSGISLVFVVILLIFLLGGRL
jgi:hypothetical protein